MSQHIKPEDIRAFIIHMGYSDEEVYDEGSEEDKANRILRTIDRVKNEIDALPDPMPVWRMVKLDHLDSLNTRTLGVYWTRNRYAAGVQNFKGGKQTFLIQATMEKANIDWLKTLSHNIPNWEEEEVIPLDGADVYINEIWRMTENKEWEPMGFSCKGNVGRYYKEK